MSVSTLGQPRITPARPMKALFASVLRGLIRQGELAVHWPDGSVTRFAGGAGPRAGIVLSDWQTVRRLATDPGLAFGEAYMDGRLEPVGCTLYELMDVVLLNINQGGSHALLRWRGKLRGLIGRLQPNTLQRSARAVAHHYDLGDELYALFLDGDRQYSCAYFRRGDETLEQAQADKKRLIAGKLKLDRPDLRVLDIGCGWGGLALTLAGEYGARVTGITLSAEQATVARQRAEGAGLGDRVQIELADYRDMDCRFDRVVSVGMMEHVGVAQYRHYFQAVRRCLTDEGVALIHHIGRSDGPGSTAAWLRKYIFPGGYSPALSEVVPSIEQSGLIITDVETLRLHYAQTIAHWRARFEGARDRIRALYDERFCRMFMFYLTAAELAFRREREVVYQIQLSPSLDALPPTRAYMLETC